ncbi:MAG TPA: hypothetical protein VGM56_05780 [Byssovorax sp.]
MENTFVVELESAALLIRFEPFFSHVLPFPECSAHAVSCANRRWWCPRRSR